MKTDDLIRAMVADNASVKPPIGRTWLVCLAAGVIAAAILFAVTLGPRSDFSWSILHAPRFQFKFVFTLAILLPALILLRRLVRPEAEAGAFSWLFGVPALLLAVAAGVEMMVLPVDHWPVYARGQNALVCMAMIPLLSAAPLVAMLYVLREGAPSRPAFAGAVAGLLAAGIGATLYASHCADDSPLFVALWYPIGIAVVTAAGTLAGARLLKW